MSGFNKSLFQSIKDALASSDNKGSPTFNEIMQTRPGNTYTVRLLPYAKDPGKTFSSKYFYFSTTREKIKKHIKRSFNY